MWKGTLYAPFPLIITQTWLRLCQGSQVQTPTKALPSWLASTFSDLEPEHPLRDLLPHTPMHQDEMEARTRNDPPSFQGAGDNNIFAFSPFDVDAPGNDDTFHEISLHSPALNPALCDYELLPCDPATANTEIQSLHLGESLGFRPFSTAGTLAVLQPTGTSNINVASSILHPSESQRIVTHVRQHVSPMGASLSGSNAAFISPPVLRRTKPDPETSLRSLHRGSPNALGPTSLTPDFQDNELPMNLFSTPGPAFTVSRPVYFDSPTGDPSLSDTLEPESYQLDLEALDFRWQPFLRKKLPDHSSTTLPNFSLHAAVAFPAAFEEPNYPSLQSPGGVAYERAAGTDALVEYDLHNEIFCGSPVSEHVTQQTSSPQLNVQSRATAFVPASGSFISPLRDAASSPVITGLADAKNDQVKIQGPIVSLRKCFTVY
jgi:hypothetical protein